MRFASLPRVQLRWIALFGLLAAFVVRPIFHGAPVAAAAPTVNVSLVSFSQWTEQVGPTTYVHLLGEVHNGDPGPASLIQVHFNLVSGTLITQETVNVGDMGANVLGAGDNSPFQDVFVAPTNYDHAEFVSITDAVSATPPDHKFTITPKPCLDPLDVCGTIQNNNPASVDNVRVIFTFYNGTTTGGAAQTVDEDALFLTNNSTSSLQPSGTAGDSADFDLVRSPDAPPFTGQPAKFGESSTTVPNAPTAVSATPGNKSALVSWTAPASDGERPITTYTVTSNPDGVTASTPDGMTTSLNLPGLRNGISYTFTVTATNPLGTSFVSAPSAPVIPATVPDAPTNVVATAGDHSATVTWTKPFDGGRAITRYTLTSSPGGVTASNDGSTTSLLVPGLNPALSYTFTVTATNAIGTGPASSPSNAVIPATVPAPPTNVSAIAGNGQATVSWTPGSDGGSPITQYTVTFSGDGIAATVIGSPPATHLTVTGLTNGTSYTLGVTATNKFGASSPPAQSNTVVPATAPGAPSNVTATAGAGFATVSWTAPSSGGSAITSFTVTGSPAGSATVDGTRTSAIIAGIPSGTYTFTVTATSTVTGPASAPSNQVTIAAGGQYHPQAPVRILDTRLGLGGSRLGPNQSINVQVAGQGGVPAMSSPTPAAAVVLNVTVTNASQVSHLTVYPAGPASPPTASNLNFAAGQTVPNLVVVALGQGGQVSVYNRGGGVDVIFDVQGWISTPQTTSGTAGLLRPLVPARLMDTRTGNGGSGKLSAGQTVNLQVTNRGGVPPTGASGVVLNVTVTNPTAASHLIVFPAGSAQPVASNLNFAPGLTVPNRVMVKLGSGGQVSIFNLSGQVDVIVDVNGWFTDGSDPTATNGEFTGMVPTRIMDTRLNGGALHGGEVRTLQVGGNGGVPAGATGVVLNVTVTNTGAASHLIVYPSDAAQPNTSDLNWTAGRTVPNLVVAKLGAGGTIAIFNLSGSVDVIVDVLGWYN